MANKIKRTPEEIAEMLSEQLQNKVEFVKEDDTFDFKCQRCGQCCMNRGDIVLSPFDIYKAAKHLGITHEEFIDKYTNVTLGGGSKLPIVLLKSDSRGWCPFLNFDIKGGGMFGCTINDVKPGACRNHPIGTATSFDNNDEHVLENMTVENLAEAYFKVSQCDNSKGHNNLVKVADWIAENKMTANERVAANRLQLTPITVFDVPKFAALLALQVTYPPKYDEYDEQQKEVADFVVKRSRELTDYFFSTILNLTYIEFTTDRPFCEQAEENIEKILEVCTEMKKLYEFFLNAFIESGGKEEDLTR